MEEKKLLVITYYWPPSGGAGVQRWLKLSKYLAKEGVKVFVLTVDENKASYTSTDASLKKDIHPNIEVIRTDSFEPINYYAKIVGKSNVPTAGFSNVDNTKFSQKLVNAIRSNFFIPDPRVGWVKYGYKAALKLIKDQGIQHVITTSPPHSTQLIGMKLKKKLKDKITWVSDFRDPWTDIYYYDILGHTAISKKIDAKLEKKVIESSDKIVTVSDGFKSLFLSKTNKVSDSKITIIPNGFDQEDFPADGSLDLSAYKKEKYTIRYTGTMSDKYGPHVFFDALKIVKERNPEKDFLFESIGSMSTDIHEYIKKTNIPFHHIPTVSHEEIVKYQQAADALLLVIPKVKNGEGIVPGKVFEYLASRSNIICIAQENSDSSKIIESVNAGKSFTRVEAEGLANYILEQMNADQIALPDIQRYSRENQAKKMVEVVFSNDD